MVTTFHKVTVWGGAGEELSSAEYLEPDAAWQHAERALLRGNRVTVQIAAVPEALAESVRASRRQRRRRGSGRRRPTWRALQLMEGW